MSSKGKVLSAECCRAFPIFLAGFSLWLWFVSCDLQRYFLHSFVDKKQIHMIWYVLTFCLAHLVAFCSEQISRAGVFIHILGRDFWAFWQITAAKHATRHDNMLLEHNDWHICTTLRQAYWKSGRCKKSSQDLRIYVEISWSVFKWSGAHTVRQVDISPAKFTARTGWAWDTDLRWSQRTSTHDAQLIKGHDNTIQLVIFKHGN